MMTRDFIVSRLIGDSGRGLFSSFKQSTVNGLELMMPSTSASRVLNDSSFKERLCVLNQDSKIALVKRINLSQTSPKLLLSGGLCFYEIKSKFSFKR